MPDCCAALRCSNYRNKCPNLSFFRFPKDEERCKIWTSFAGRELQDTVYMNANFRLCSAHFAMDQFSTAELNRLKSNAVPSLDSNGQSTSPSFDYVLSDSKVCTSMPVFPGMRLQTHEAPPTKIARKENHSPHQQQLQLQQQQENQLQQQRQKQQQQKQQQEQPQQQPQMQPQQPQQPHLQQQQLQQQQRQQQQQQRQQQRQQRQQQQQQPHPHHCDLVSTMVQTDPVWANVTGIMTLESRVAKLEGRVKSLESSLVEVEAQNYELRIQLSEQQSNSISPAPAFSVEHLRRTVDNNTFHYHTGFTFDGFKKFQNLMMNAMTSISYTDTIPAIQLNIQDQLLLTLMRLNNLDSLEDLSFRFGITSHTAGVLVDSWVNHMYLRFHNLSTWPHRDTIFQNMPTDFALDFPTTLAMIDYVEVLMEDDSLRADGFSYMGLKGLVATDPQGSIIFVSKLCSKGFSPSQIYHESGIGDHLFKLKQEGKIYDGDSVIVPEELAASTEFAGVGLHLLTTPAIKERTHLTPTELARVDKMASHRILIKRTLSRIKKFQILCGMVPHELQYSVHKLWYVCAHLTNFQDHSETD